MFAHPLFDTATLIAYLLAVIALVLAPGPGQALVLARTIEGGARAGRLTAFGLQIGTLVHTIAAAVGVSAILAASATAFAVVKYLGAIYLVLLGVVALRHSQNAPEIMPSAKPAPNGRRLLIHAAITGVLNPKVAVFFLAFLPQFVRPERGAVLAQFIVLGGLFAALGFAWDAVLASAVGRARNRFATSARFAAWRQRVTGVVLIGLGLRLALPDRR